jgi:hypothetical protein
MEEPNSGIVSPVWATGCAGRRKHEGEALGSSRFLLLSEAGLRWGPVPPRPRHPPPPSADLAITTTSLPNVVQGQSYNVTFHATEGSALTWSRLIRCPPD